jgi:hypothetical protein
MYFSDTDAARDMGKTVVFVTHNVLISEWQMKSSHLQAVKF